MRIFLTGATGFIGRSFCRLATESGHELLALVRPGSAVSGLPRACRTCEGSLDDPPWDRIAAFSPDAAVHLAWVATPGVYLHSPENRKLVRQSAALWQGLLDRKVGHLVGVGTCLEYEPSKTALPESAPTARSLTPYSEAKLAALHRLEELAFRTGTKHAWLRIFYPYGGHEPPGKLPSAILRKVEAGETVALKTPDSIKDYIHVDDVASAILTVLESPLTGIVNVGTGRGIQIEDLARHLAKRATGRDDLVARDPIPFTDPFPITVADPAKLLAAGWRPETDLDSGIDELLASIRAGSFPTT